MTVEATWEGERAKIAAQQATQRGVNIAAHRVQAVAVPLTPMETGDLRSSLLVTEGNDPSNPVAAVSSDLPYAIKQHESLHFRHQHGQAKFLETAVIQSRSDVRNIIATQLRRALGQ